MTRFNGKTALVTGASRGIGREIALAFGREGALVAVHYGNNKRAAHEVVEAIEKEGGRAFAIQADLSQNSEITNLFETLDAELGKRTGDNQIDILVNNAGIGLASAFEETTEEDFDRLFGTNVKGVFFVSQKAASRIRDNGRVINVSSVVTRLGFPGYLAYSATKGAIDTFTLHLAGVLGKRGITVNAVAPGPTETDMTEGWMKNPEARSALIAGQTIPRIGQPKDIAEVALLLALPESAWVTGQIIDASGGFRLG